MEERIFYVSVWSLLSRASCVNNPGAVGCALGSLFQTATQPSCVSLLGKQTHTRTLLHRPELPSQGLSAGRVRHPFVVQICLVKKLTCHSVLDSGSFVSW